MEDLIQKALEQWKVNKLANLLERKASETKYRDENIKRYDENIKKVEEATEIISLDNN